jgi:hypothetical protein
MKIIAGANKICDTEYVTKYILSEYFEIALGNRYV